MNALDERFGDMVKKVFKRFNDAMDKTPTSAQDLTVHVDLEDLAIAAKELE